LQFFAFHRSPDFLTAQKLFLRAGRFDRFNLPRREFDMRSNELIGLRKHNFCA
jgi:hypothetical protein